MRAFIVRPFGVQEEIDFDRVQLELIEPALALLREWKIPMDGGTTGSISKAGNIREDMFRLLAVSDLVIADVTIHNANAFYELGMRHALRAGSTQLIRARGSKFKYPFDLQTDRYFNYDLDNLKGDVEALAMGLRATLAERRDSPIFLLLKDLKPHGRRNLVKVPDDFREDVMLARKTNRRGDLRLLAEECHSFEWDREGLTLVGEAQFQIRAYGGAKDTFDLLRDAAPNDYHANWRLGTIFQRLASSATGADKTDLTTRSEQAIDRALGEVEDRRQEAELHALRGSNAKNRWIEDFGTGSAEQRGQQALQSPCLQLMIDCYLKAAGFDLNEHYPAVNALAFIKVQIELAKRFPDDWAAVANEADPDAALKKRVALADRLTANLRLSLRLDEMFKSYQSPADDWSNSSVADLFLLSDPANTAAIASRYRSANSNPGTDRFTLEAGRRNLDIFKELKLLEPGVDSAIKVIDDEIRKRAPPEQQLKRALLFTGHMVDAANRPPEKARFPRTAKAENIARQLIYDAVKKAVGDDAASAVGIAGGACGGDILFHEVCAELGIKTELYLALPAADYQAESVDQGGDAWVERFQTLCRNIKTQRVLQKSKAPPDWLASLKGYNIWERTNLWMMFCTLGTGATQQTLIALFNEDQEPDGPGGTKHLLREAKKHGLRTISVDARPLLK